MSESSRVSRRDFVGGAAATLFGAAVVPGGRRQSWRSRGSGEGADTWELYVGTYTVDTASRGIYRAVIDRSRGGAISQSLVAETANPSFLALTPNGRQLVAVSELTTYEGSASGGVTLFARDTRDGSLVQAAARASLGGAPCYVELDPRGRYALVANYVGGSVAVFPVGADGTLGGATAMEQHHGDGPVTSRQEAAHAHCVRLDPTGRLALVADLGIDRIKVYRFDAEGGTLAAAPELDVAMRGGAGPRHLAFAPDGRTLYVVNELDSTLVSLAYDPTRGPWRERQRLSTRAAGATGENLPADLHVHPSGRFVYASNRGDDVIAVFAVDRADGSLALVQSVPTGGRWPRNFALDPTGALLLVANQRSDSIVAFRVDPDSGRLAPTGGRIAVPAPVCVRFGGAGAAG